MIEYIVSYSREHGNCGSSTGMSAARVLEFSFLQPAPKFQNPWYILINLFNFDRITFEKYMYFHNTSGRNYNRNIAF